MKDKKKIEAAKKVHDFLTVGAAAPLQEAAVTGLNFPESYYENLLERLPNMIFIFCCNFAVYKITR